jgi:hypothetical protein
MKKTVTCFINSTDEDSFFYLAIVSTASSGVEKRILIFTLGFDASAVIARFTEIEVKGTEELVFLVPSKSTDRSENTILSLQQFVNSCKQ